MRVMTLLAGIVLLVALLGAGCKKGGVPEKRKLNIAAECRSLYQRHQAKSDRKAFMAVCQKSDMSLFGCVGMAAGSGFCKRKMKDPKSGAQIRALKKALGK